MTSFKHDCMNGDYTKLQLHMQYFENPYSLMDRISAGYRERFAERLASRLRLLESDSNNKGSIAPASSFVDRTIPNQ